MSETPTFDPAVFVDAISETDEKITRGRDTHKFDNNPYVAHVNKSRETGTVLKVVVPGRHVKELTAYLRDAAEKGGHGLRLSVPKNIQGGKPTEVKFQAVEKRKRAERAAAVPAECPVCHKLTTVTGEGTLRVHGPRDNRCAGSGTKPA